MSTATPTPSPNDPGDMNTSSSLLETSPSIESFSSENNLARSQSPTNQSINVIPSPERFSSLLLSDCGLPLQLFTKGNLVHPYLSLQYLDVLNSPTTRSYIAGVSNALFLHKKDLYDVLVQFDADEGKIEINDPELKQQLGLSTEDLRFADHLVKQVTSLFYFVCHFS